MLVNYSGSVGSTLNQVLLFLFFLFNLRVKIAACEYDTLNF